MRRRMSKTSGSLRGTGWSDWLEIGAGSTASESMRSGGFASCGKKEVRKMSNSSTTTEDDLIEPIHPGEILMEDFIEGFGITQNKLAVSIGVSPRRINEIVHGKRSEEHTSELQSR